MQSPLARVFWAMGQALLPAHLRALEDSLLADNALRYRQQDAPCYGFSNLRWSESLLTEGVLTIDEMTLQLPSGLLLKLKDNAQITPLNLNILGGTLIPVYVHVRSASEDAGQIDANIKTVKHENINFWQWSLELSAEQESFGITESVRVADFEKQPDGTWQLSSRYIPPLLAVRASPFLKAQLTLLNHQLESYHYQLTQEIAAIYLSGSDLVNARQCLKSIVQMQRFMGNLLAEISPHPYTLYERLKEFYVELCFYHDHTPASATVPYRHEKLAELFSETFASLNEQLQFNRQRSPYLPFTVSGSLVRVDLPASIRQAKQTFLLVQKAAITKPVNLDGVKIAAVSRLADVHKFYLQGVPCKRMDRPPFQHSFGPEVDIYQLTEGEEWDHVLKELSLGFYNDVRFADEKFFLYWRAA